MQLNQGIKAVLLKDYGFHVLDEDYKKENGLNDSPIEYMDGFIFDLGESRRGQFYYLICSNEGEFSIVATDPDGSGGAISLKKMDIFSKLFSEGIAC